MGMPVKERCDVDQNTGEEVVDDSPETSDNTFVESVIVSNGSNSAIVELSIKNVVVGGEYDVMDKNGRWCEGSVR
jgi:hypothetical protein